MIARPQTQDGDQPGGGWYSSDISSLCPITGTPIKVAWSFDKGATFDLTSYGKGGDEGLAQFMECKFGCI